MAHDAVADSILEKNSCYMVAAIGHRFRYLTCCKKNVELLRNQIPHLRAKRDGVQGEVDAATRNGDEIKPDVRMWLAEVDKFMKDAQKWVEEIDAKKRYLKWWHPNLKLSYKLGKEATRILYIVMGLQGKGENTPPLGIEAMPAFFPASVESLSVSLPAPQPGIEFMSIQDFVAFESTKSTLNQILEALMDENCNMVELYGMGGIGKTTLVKEVGKKVKEQKLFDEVVMAVVSENQDVRKIQGKIANMLGLTFDKEGEPGRAGLLHARLKKEKRVLVILDDVLGRLDLKAIGIPHGVEHEGCKIALTTRRIEVYTPMGIQTKKIPVNVLLDEESWELFRSHVGVDIDSTPLNVPAKAVVKECKGLPIALVTVGRALRNKDREEWNAAVQQLKKSKAAKIEGLDHDVISCIRLGYDYLRGEETKLCFLICCLFPEDYDISLEYLARYAMGKGLIKDVDTMEEARSRVRTIIKDLKASCMLLDSNKEGCVKLHDIVRDAAISIASDGGNHDLFLVRANAGLKVWPLMETFESYTGISLMTNDLQELPQSGLECPNLQILLLGENEGIEAIPESFFEGMRRLKVLDLSGKDYWHFCKKTTITSDLLSPILSLPSSIKFLVNLRTLHLNGRKLGNLSALGIVKKLEILSFRGSDIRALPEEIGELINLRLLDLTWCKDLTTFPPNVISKLTRLEELYMGGSFRDWEVDEGTSEERSSASLSELQLLLRLTNLCVRVNEVACFPENFLSPNLQKFEIEVRDHDWNWNAFMNYYPNSRTSLYLNCDDVPSNDNFKTLFQMVEDLTLSFLNMSGSCDNILASIDAGGLTGLKSLNVNYCDGIESLIDTTNQWKPPVILFVNLEVLLLSDLDNMEIVCRGLIPDGSLEKLRVLKIEDCPELQVIVDFVHRLKKLEEVQVQDCEKVEVIFQLNDDIVAAQGHANLDLVLLSSLRKFKLIGLPELLSIWKWNGSTSLVSLCNLTEVEIYRCEKLSNLFSPSLAQSLLNLETLIIDGCNNLETIVAEEDQLSNNYVQPVGFPKLKFIQVWWCKRLTSLFTIATARSLVKLHRVSLMKNDQLLEIVSHGREGEGEEGDEKEILLPQLNKLDLSYLPKLERLCPGSFNMDLPSLKELVVKDCPMLKKFAADATAYYGLKSAVIQNLFTKQPQLVHWATTDWEARIHCKSLDSAPSPP